MKLDHSGYGTPGEKPEARMASLPFSVLSVFSVVNLHGQKKFLVVPVVPVVAKKDFLRALRG
jgi:hypothetical protein